MYRTSASWTSLALGETGCDVEGGALLTVDIVGAEYTGNNITSSDEQQSLANSS